MHTALSVFFELRNHCSSRQPPLIHILCIDRSVCLSKIFKRRKDHNPKRKAAMSHSIHLQPSAKSGSDQSPSSGSCRTESKNSISAAQTLIHTSSILNLHQILDVRAEHGGIRQATDAPHTTIGTSPDDLRVDFRGPGGGHQQEQYALRRA